MLPARLQRIGQCLVRSEHCTELKTQKMKNNKTLYHFIVDQSGSMANCVSDTIAGFNHQIDTLQALSQKHLDMEFLYSMTLFNSEVSHHADMQKPEYAAELNNRNYVPGGSTSLLDAVGLSLQRIERTLGSDIENDKATVVVVIMTDGHENSSRIFSFKDISSMVSRLERTEKWTFNFLGADIDAFSVSRGLGFHQENSMSFNKVNMQSAMRNVEACMEDYTESKSQGKVKTNFFDIFKGEERD